jgi:hypothetical protein
MKKILMLVMFVSLFCAEGLANTYAKVNGPFTTYSHETFVKNDTGETGLYIDGEDWYALINLSGFKDADMKFTSSNEFLFQIKDEIILTAFAGEMKNVPGDKSCIDRSVPKEYQKEVNGKKIALSESVPGRKSLNYYPYYKGYCFDFHFSLPAKDEKKVFDIINSIKFIDGKFSNTRIKKYFYTYDKRIELIIPSDWKVTFDEKAAKNMPTIEFLPDNGNSFKMLVSPYGKIFGKPVSVDIVRQIAMEKFEQMAPSAVEKPVFKEMKNNKMNMFYYCDLQDKDYKPNNQNDFPFLCQGHAEIEGSALHFTILYREKGNADVKNGLDAIKNSKILDLKK